MLPGGVPHHQEHTLPTVPKVWLQPSRSCRYLLAVLLGPPLSGELLVLYNTVVALCLGPLGLLGPRHLAVAEIKFLLLGWPTPGPGLTEGLSIASWKSLFQLGGPSGLLFVIGRRGGFAPPSWLSNSVVRNGLLRGL